MAMYFTTRLDMVLQWTCIVVYASLPLVVMADAERPVMPVIHKITSPGDSGND